MADVATLSEVSEQAAETGHLKVWKDWSLPPERRESGPRPPAHSSGSLQAPSVSRLKPSSLISSQRFPSKRQGRLCQKDRSLNSILETQQRPLSITGQ